MVRTTPDHYRSNDEARARARAALAPRPVQAPDDLWSRVSHILRYVLPGLAACVAVLTLAWPFLNTAEVAFTLAKDEVAPGDSRGRVLLRDLTYVGTDARNRRFEITATAGEQKSPSDPEVSLSELAAEMMLEPGNPMRVRAHEGLYRIEAQKLDLAGSVAVRLGGYALDMDRAEIDLAARLAAGEGRVRGQSELGALTARTMQLNIDAQTGVFAGGVTLHIIPRRPTGAPPGVGKEQGR